MKNEISKSMVKQFWGEYELKRAETARNIVEMREAVVNDKLVVTNQAFVEKVMHNKKDETSLEIKNQIIEEKCRAIRRNIERGELENVEVRFNIMTQWCLNSERKLADTYVKIWVMDEIEPLFLFLTKDTMMNALVFIGGDEKQAFLVFVDDKNITHYVQLQEFYLLSIVKEKKMSWGLITSYSWFSARVSTDIIQSFELNSVVDLFMAEWFRKMVEEKKNKDVKEISTNEEE